MIQGLPPAPPPIAEIIITARALPDPAAERAYGVDRLDRTRLSNNGSTKIDQILKEVPGLQLFRRSDARSGHPTSQGVTLRALGGNAASRALLVLDGVPQSDPFGGWVNWPAYDPAALAEVRIVRGGGSVGNGPGALAGFIDMTSALNGGVEAGLSVGSRQSAEGRVAAGSGAAGGRLALTARGERGDGFVPITPSSRGPVDRAAPYKAASGRLLWIGPLSGTSEIQLAASAFTDRRDRGVAFTGNRTDGANASVRFVGRGSLAWSALAYGQWRELESSFASVGAGRATVSRASLQDSVPSRAYGGALDIRPRLGAVDLRIGADTRLTVGETRELFSYVAGDPTRRRVAGGKSLTAGAFAEASGDLGKLALSGGFRIDRWQIWDGELRERVIATGAALRDDAFASRGGWRTTARAGAVYSLAEAWSVRSSAYLGWRLPTLNELFRPFRAGPDATAANALLKPEGLSGAEAGIDYRRNGVTISLTGFTNGLTDSIANVTLGQGPGTFPGVGFVGAGGEYRERQNLDSIRVRGLEASAEARHGRWTWRAGISVTDAQISARGSAATLDGLRPAQTPRFAATAGATWQDKGRVGSLTLRHVGNQFEDDLNQGRLAPATTLDAFAAWPLSSSLQVTLRGENLLDELVVAGIGNDGAIERATPRTLWIGLRVSR